MKFSTVEIRQDFSKPEKWHTHFSDLPGDRQDDGSGPHSLGFYHYPRKIGQHQAFETLRNFLVEQHEKEIQRLQTRVQGLKDLKGPTKT